MIEPQNYNDSLKETIKQIIIEAIEDYCLNKAMDEGHKSPLYDHAEALRFLED